jgi:tRNA(fMet)-specific endonuclease VapC
LPFLIDTNIAIHMRDGDRAVSGRVEALGEFPHLSIISATELEGGVYRVPGMEAFRRARLDTMLAELPLLLYGPEESATYGRIVAATAYSRARLIDRMIAATALVHDLTLVTMNARDFRDVPGLKLEAWDLPTPHPPS